jgi:phosphopantothenoylcysteine decarboxylase/phosphopantothenate--cysteine ligase
MGYALAAEAARRGARVVLISGPSSQTPPQGIEVVRVRGAREMHGAVLAHAKDAEIVIMAAAVADYMPTGGAVDAKIEKSDAPLTLTLERTPDILADLGRARRGGTTPVLIGFAAESGDPVRRGREKLHRKAVDLIVANDISKPGSGFDSDKNAATLISADGDESVPLGSKAELASHILDRAERLLERADNVSRPRESSEP